MAALGTVPGSINLSWPLLLFLLVDRVAWKGGCDLSTQRLSPEQRWGRKTTGSHHRDRQALQSWAGSPGPGRGQPLTSLDTPC